VIDLFDDIASEYTGFFTFAVRFQANNNNPFGIL